MSRLLLSTWGHVLDRSRPAAESSVNMCQWNWQPISGHREVFETENLDSVQTSRPWSNWFCYTELTFLTSDTSFGDFSTTNSFQPRWSKLFCLLSCVLAHLLDPSFNPLGFHCVLSAIEHSTSQYVLEFRFWNSVDGDGDCSKAFPFAAVRESHIRRTVVHTTLCRCRKEDLAKMEKKRHRELNHGRGYVLVHRQRS